MLKKSPQEKPKNQRKKRNNRYKARPAERRVFDCMKMMNPEEAPCGASSGCRAWSFSGASAPFRRGDFPGLWAAGGDRGAR